MSDPTWGRAIVREGFLPGPTIWVDPNGRAVVGTFAQGYSLGDFLPARRCDIYAGEDRTLAFAHSGAHLRARDCAASRCMTAHPRHFRRVCADLRAQAGRLMADVRR